MKPVKLLIYLGIFLALVAYVYLVEIKHKQKKEEAEKAAKKIVHIHRDKILKVELLDRDKTVIKLEKLADKWVMAVPVKTKGDDPAIDALLYTLTEAEPEKEILEKDVKWDEYGLDKPEFSVVFSTSDATNRLSFGAANPAKTSYYLRLNDEPKLLLAADTLRNGLRKSVFDLRDKSVFRLAETDVDRILITHKGIETEFLRKDSNKWVESKPESFTAKGSVMASNLRTLTNLKAKDIIDDPAKTADPYGLDKPEESIVLSGQKLEQTLLLGKALEKKDPAAKEPERYARIKDEDTVFVLDGRSLKSLKLAANEVRDKSLLSFNPADIERMEIDFDGKQWVAALDKDKHWNIEKPEKKLNVDAWTVTGVLWDIKDLEWKSLAKPIPDDLGSLNLDKPGLVVTLFKKDDKQPLVLKAGWKPVSPVTDTEDKDRARQENKPAEAGKTQSDKDSKKQESEESKQADDSAKTRPVPESLNALAQPTAEPGAVFVLDGSFLTRISGDLNRWIQSK